MNQRKQLIGVGILLGVLVLMGIGAALLLQRTRPPALPELQAPEGYVPPEPGRYPPPLPRKERLEQLRTEPTISWLSFPSSVSAGGVVEVSFIVSIPFAQGSAEATFAGVHFGPESRGFVPHEELSEATYPQRVLIPEGEPLSLPRPFTVTFAAPADLTTLYLRAHVIMEGERHLWTDEVSIQISH